MKCQKIILLIVSIIILLQTNCNKENELEQKLQDIEGNTYKIVTIGNQTWMAENLKSTKDRHGNPIPNIVKNEEWGKLESNNIDKAYAYSNNDPYSEYGALFTYAAAIKVCPVGWHLPSKEEWNKLEDYLNKNGFSGFEGNALRATNGWCDLLAIEENGTDNFGFSALPGGARLNEGTNFHRNFMGYWWTNSEKNDTIAYIRTLFALIPEIQHEESKKSRGLSIRCIKDEN